jgi:hypothetical protein
MNMKLMVLLAFFLSSATAFANESAPAKDADHQQAAQEHTDGAAESHSAADAAPAHEQHQAENTHEAEKHGK